MTYKIHKELWACYKNFSSLILAEEFAISLGIGYLVEEASVNDQIVPLDGLSKLKQDIVFGEQMVSMFLLDNRLLGPFTTQETLTMLTKFQPVKELLNVGSIQQAKEVTETIVVDSIFTQARKDSYIAALTNYINLYI